MVQKKHIFFFLILLLYGCNSTKFVPNGKFLLNGVKVKTTSRDISKNEIKDYIHQFPNSKTLGLFNMQSGIYNLAGKDSTFFMNRWLKKIGSKPIIYDADLTFLSKRQIEKFCFNKGYMDVKVTTKEDFSDKKVNITYIVEPNKPHTIASYRVDITENSELSAIANDTTKITIKKGQLFDVNLINKERERVSLAFRNLGYYHFTKNNLHFYADTTYENHTVNLKLKVIKKDKDTKIFNKYQFNNIYFINKANSLLIDNEEQDEIDTLRISKFHFYNYNKKKLRPSLLIEKSHILPENFFSSDAIKQTYTALNSLSAVRFVDINLKELDENQLDVFITLTHEETQSISTAVEATYSAGYFGVGTNIGHNHKNIFNGSENLTLNGNIAYEYQGKGQNAYEFGTKVELEYPTFLLPFLDRDIKRNIRAKTMFNLNYNYRQRPEEYTGIITGAGIKYKWSEKFNIKHSIDVFDLSYVHYPYISDNYRDYLKTSPYFMYNFRNHLIMKIGYNGLYTGYSKEHPLRDYITMNYAIETAGNFTHAFNHLLNRPKDKNGFYSLLGINYSQYIKADYSVSKHLIYDKNNRIVFHARTGLAVPYGNSVTVPFEKRYFAGGANSVRGWTAYQLGPGTFDSNKIFIDYNTQMGDVKLDLNMEYRSKLFWKFEGALFLDAGNVWTIKDYDIQPKGAFKFGTFAEQLGWAYGVGIRTDFSFFIFRVDLGVKLYDPAKSRLERWRTPLNTENYAFNLAIGYPF